MHYYEVAPNQIIRAGNASFTYESDVPLTSGQLVTVEVGKKIVVGVVLHATKKPPYATKAIMSIIEAQPLPRPLLLLASWLSDYYVTPLATVLQTLLPAGIQKTRHERPSLKREQLRDRTTIVFTDEQRRAVEKIEQMPSGSAILHGVTGSGKTAVYIELAKRTLARGHSIIILVPEIALTSQLVDEFSAVFEDILLTHSHQTEAERHTTWRKALLSTLPQLAVGPRSALFLPLTKIGLIIIDESHESSYKQEQSPRYSALRAASILAKAHEAKLLLGSATPSITDYYIATRAGRPIIPMASRARRDAVTPSISIIDMTNRTHFQNHRFLSDKLLKQLTDTIESDSQALIFHNRRGSASTTLCENCGWQAICPRCFIPFTFHGDHHHLRCHICGLTDKIPTSCPECQTTDIIHKGIGTKLIESELRKLFPNKIIARFDGDNEKGASVEDRYRELYTGEIDIIIGTQVIAKGLDLPKLRTVGVLQADAGLSLPDYSSSERTFQLLAQVIGRVGRSNHSTNVIVQSYQSTHPAVAYGLKQDYKNFYSHTLSERKRANFPPFCYLLKLTCIYKTEAATIKNAQQLARALRLTLPADVQILGPTPAFYERQHDTYRWQLVLKSPSRSALVAAIRHIPPTHWQFEIDPVSLL